jgi:hypothetical protein
MTEMFQGATAVNQDLSKWRLRHWVRLQNIFAKSGLSKGNFCKLKGLKVWRVAQLGKDFGCGSTP